MRKTLTLAILTASLAAPSAMAQDAASDAAAPPPPCSSDEYRQMDFWVGDWIAEWDNGDGTVGTGTNRVTRDEFGDCVITEHFSGPGLNGLSVSTYFAPIRRWRQTWVDDQGGYFALIGGPDPSVPDRFELRNSRLSESAPYLRMVWEDITPESFVWRWQSKPSEEADWVDRWVIRYRRQ